MSTPKNSTQFAEMERLIGDYFSQHLAPVMARTQSDLSAKRAEETRSWQSGLTGLLASADTNGMAALGGERLKMVGEWNSKTVDDYLEMVKRHISSDKSLQQDLSTIAQKWREVTVGEIGRERYDEVSRQLGCDLAYAYLDHRLEELMIDKLASDKMPASTTDYIIQKAAGSSLFGLAGILNSSPLAQEVDKRGEQAYRPSGKEKLAGRAAGALADGIALGGASGWAAVARYVGVDVVLGTAIDSAHKGREKTVTVEQCISKGVFGTDTNVFTGLRKQARGIDPQTSKLITSTDAGLRNKTIPETNYKMPKMEFSRQEYNFPVSFSQSKEKETDKYAEVPLAVAPGYEEEYLKDKEAEAGKENAQSDPRPEYDSQSIAQSPQLQPLSSGQDTNSQQAAGSSTNGWASLLSATGLSGFGDVAKNFGYVISMLPDIMVGLFTGKSKSLSLGNNMMPIAAILAGMFIKNPLLKLLLIGAGATNIINKAGHEAISWQKQEEEKATPKFKQYADQPLSPRVTNPVMRGGTLIASIDGVPCNIQLTSNVVAAYNAGALPLNTLANAVLARHDAMGSMVEQQTINQSMPQQESIHRSR